MRYLLILLLVLLAGLGGWFGRGQFGSRPQVASDSERNQNSGSEILQPTTIRGIGKLEPESGIVKIYAPQGERVDSLYGREVGDKVNVGDAIVKLAGLEVRRLELDVALARREDATRKLDYENSKGSKKKEVALVAIEEAKSIREQIDAKRKSIELLDSQRRASLQQLQRLENLRSNDLTSKMVGQTDIEKQELLIEQLAAKISAARDEIRLGLGKADRAEKAANIELQAIDSALENASSLVPMHSLDAAISAAEKAVELSEIKSPSPGRILDIAVQPGDTATTQPVLLIGDTEKMICVAEINDVSFRHVKVGAKATISSVALESEITGKVISRGVMIGPPSMKDPNPFAGVDRKTGRVVIELGDSSIAKDFVNLQVDVEIDGAPESSVQ